MNKNEKIKQMDLIIEQALNGNASGTDTPSIEEQNLHEIAGSLASFDARSQSGVESQLKQKLLRQMADPKIRTSSSNRQPRLRRYSLATLVLASVLIIAVIAIPPVRAAAENLFTQIGNLILKNNPTDAQQYVATMQSGIPTPTLDPNWVCTDCPEPVIMGVLTAQQASDKAGYRVYEPQYIPEGYELTSRDVFQTDKTITTSSSFSKELEIPLHDGLQFSGIIAIGQTHYLDGSQPNIANVGEVPIVDVTVRGNPGVWLEQVPIYPFQDAEGNWQYAYWNQLEWSEDGFNFMIQTNMPADLLPLEELMKIADSLN